ncbi:hypothetical protein [Nocardioides sp.]|uniref:hypothetical protein n=1 Tax=Nocardioides sp. TaxID=35761 RepID=UPI002CDC5178|nr:hypothetical protein [Nocardioides sp.]HSX68313.1 hypothetical protein [Nocardioides sp.]
MRNAALVGGLAVAALVLSACAEDGGRPAADSTALPNDAATAAAQAPLRELAPLLPEEVEVGRADGTGDRTSVIRSSADSAMVVYGVCAGGAAHVVTAPGTAMTLTIPCDGVVSRSQLILVPGTDLPLDIAGDGGAWRLLLTRLPG